MMNVHGKARLGVLAVGLGIGAGWAHAPLASADSSTDWLSTIDGFLTGASPAAAAPIDLDISFDGYTLFDVGGGASASTNTGDFSLAIAYGDNANALAVGTGGVAVADGADTYAASGGTGDVAVADGSGALAWASGGNGDLAEAVGTNADAWAGGAGMGVTGADDDTAIDIGNNSVPAMYGVNQGAYAGNSDLAGGTDGATGVHDTAIDIGNNTSDNSLGSTDGAFAGAGGLIGGVGDGNNDTAIDVGNNSGVFNGADAVDGDGNYANLSGSTDGIYQYVYAGLGNDNTAIADTSYTANGQDVDAFGGNDNVASVLGPVNSTAYADTGDSNIAYVLDPFGSAGSPDSAIAGGGFSNDLADVLFAHGVASADTANLLYDIVSLFGNFSGSF